MCVSHEECDSQKSPSMCLPGVSVCVDLKLDTVAESCLLFFHLVKDGVIEFSRSSDRREL